MRLRSAFLAGLCLTVSANGAFAACIGARDAAALRIAALQQRLMVAGLACTSVNGRGGSEDYNRFVLAHRAELQRSDDDLKAWFIANGGEAGYDSYKTKLANLAAHGPATDRGAFCAATADDFHDLATSGDLLAAAAGERLLVGEACEATVVAVKAAPKEAPKDAPVRVARNEEIVAPGPRELPAMPYAEAPPPRPQAAVATRDDVIAAPQAVAAGRGDYADASPRPAARRDSDRYWYYRRLYAQGLSDRRE